MELQARLTCCNWSFVGTGMFSAFRGEHKAASKLFGPSVTTFLDSESVKSVPRLTIYWRVIKIN